MGKPVTRNDTDGMHGVRRPAAVDPAGREFRISLETKVFLGGGRVDGVGRRGGVGRPRALEIGRLKEYSGGPDDLQF